MRFKCDYCKKDFEVKPSRRPHKLKFCTILCRNKYYSGIKHHFFNKKQYDMIGKNNPRYNQSFKPIKCNYCNKLFRPLPSKIKWGRGKFCSRGCYAEYRKMIKRKYVRCFNCEKEYWIHLSAFKNQKRFFCSKKCEGEYKRGRNNPFYGKKHSEKTLRKILSKIHNKPNTMEQRLINLFEEHNLPFKYVGDGSVIINGLNPDFIETNGKKLIIEFFGRPFHDINSKLRSKIPYNRTELGRIEAFKTIGYNTLIIWDTELKNEEEVLTKVRNFIEKYENA